MQDLRPRMEMPPEGFLVYREDLPWEIHLGWDPNRRAVLGVFAGGRPRPEVRGMLLEKFSHRVMSCSLVSELLDFLADVPVEPLNFWGLILEED